MKLLKLHDTGKVDVIEILSEMLQSLRSEDVRGNCKCFVHAAETAGRNSLA